DIFKVEKTQPFSRCFEEVLFAFLNYFPKAKLLFFRPHNMGRRDDFLQRQYGERAIALCKKWGVPFVDLYSESGMNTFIPEQRDLFTFDSYDWGRGDCTHPNALGYELKYMPLIEAKLKTL
ncbi:MAG: SGNH/GDSL hydrolase family protein, partial [Clostridia bacterium]|nr:SGNH/GDSL hydrolase family protein [Clostridia bacterium]